MHRLVIDAEPLRQLTIPCEPFTFAQRVPETGLAASIMILLELEFLLPTEVRTFNSVCLPISALN